MATVKILVIDDDHTFLRLTAAILRKGGYEVHIASNPRQALTSLLTLRADVILVDVQMPGLTGVALTRQFRADPRTKDAVILVTTAFSEAEIEKAAKEAGCDGYLRKPFDPEALTAFVQGHLRRESVLARSPRGTGSWPEDPARVFLEQACSRCQTLLRNFDSGYPGSTASEMLRQLGAESTEYGFAAVPALAHSAAELMQGFLRDPPLLWDRLNGLSAELVKLKAEADTKDFPALRRALKAWHIAVAGFQTVEAAHIGAFVEGQGASVQRIPSGGPLEPELLRGCNLAIVRIGGMQPEPHWLSPELSKTPMIFALERGYLASLDPKVLSHARDILVDDWQGGEALMRISLAISRESAPVRQRELPEAREMGLPDDTQPSVLVVDDDPSLGRLIRELLKNLGIRCLVAADGREAQQILAGCRPDAAIIDINLPGMDGFGVMEMIRRQVPGIRIMFLTGRDGESDLVRGFQMGADDYLTKPFSHLELVARLKRLLPSRVGLGRVT